MDQSSSIAAAIVFNIPELLEAILFELPALDLPISQAVNKQFKATVERSVKIQRKLFFKTPLSATHGAATVNPLLLRILRQHFPACRVRRWADLAFDISAMPEHMKVLIVSDV